MPGLLERPETFENTRVTFTLRELVVYGGLALGAVSGWYTLRERIVKLETKQEFLHGDFKLPGDK